MVDFIPASELKIKFDVFGHFYSVKVAPDTIMECRSVLELIDKNVTPAQVSQISQRCPDAVFIMMNPGSSQPLVEVNNLIPAKSINELQTSLVPTKPDTTQYQVMRLMSYCDWKHVRVLNLSDLRCSKSIEFFKQFKQLEARNAFDAHSIFSTHRTRELAAKLTKELTVPIVCAWGLSDELNPLIDRCLANLNGARPIRGLTKNGTLNKYLHPLPSLQSQKLMWVNQMVQQCRL